MKLTSRTEYALLALAHLGRRYGEPAVPLPEIAEAEGIPARFLHQIFQSLKAARLVFSTKGRVGGFALARPPEEITLAEVVRLFDGPLAPTDSVSVHFYHKTPIERNPELVRLFREIRDYISERLESVTLADIS